MASQSEAVETHTHTHTEAEIKTHTAETEKHENGEARASETKKNENGETHAAEAEKHDNGEAAAAAADVPSSTGANSALVDYHLHVKTPPLDEATTALIKQFREELEKEPIYADNPYCQHYATDRTLYAYLRARTNDLKKAKKLLLGTLEWRLKMRPDHIKPEVFEVDQKCGKMLIRHFDRHNRPIWLMDSSRDNTKRDHDRSLAQLFFHLEYARRIMKDGVEKYCLVVNLSKYSYSTSPPMKTSMETLTTLVDRFPEHLGHAILYQPPRYFQILWSACKPFLDAKTVSKIHFIRGDCGENTKNHEIMCELIGPDWKEKCELAEGEEAKASSYNHERDFPVMVEEHRRYMETVAPHLKKE